MISFAFINNILVWRVYERENQYLHKYANERLHPAYSASIKVSFFGIDGVGDGDGGGGVVVAGRALCVVYGVSLLFSGLKHSTGLTYISLVTICAWDFVNNHDIITLMFTIPFSSPQSAQPVRGYSLLKYFTRYVCMYVIILFLHLLKSIHNMFYKTTYNGITLQG